MAAMEINCWHRVGVKNAPRDRVRCRDRSAGEVTELRAAIRAARAGEATGVLYELPRGYTPAMRLVARLLVGVAPVVVIAGLMLAVVAPSSVAALLVIVGALVGGATWAVSAVVDTGVRIDGAGVLRVDGWRGIRELPLRDYPRVTVKVSRDNDIALWID